LRDSKSARQTQRLCLYGSSERGTWLEGSLLGTLKARSSQYPETESKTDFGPSPTAKTRLLSFNRTQSKFVIGLFIGDNTLRRHFYLTGLTNSLLVEGMEQKMKPQPMLYDCEALALLIHTYLGSFLLDPVDVQEPQSVSNPELL